MNKKEKSAWGVFFTSVALPLVFVSLLSFQGCGSNLDGSGGSDQDGSGGLHQGGSGGLRQAGSGGLHQAGSGGSDQDGSGGLDQDETRVEKNDFFQGPPGASRALPAARSARSRKDLFKAWESAGLWNFIQKSVGGSLVSSLKPEHDRIIEQLEKKSRPNSLMDVYTRAVPLLLVVVDVKDSSQNDYIAVAGASIQEGVFRKASKEEKENYKNLDFRLFDLKNNLHEYEKYRLIEDYDFGSDGTLDESQPNGDVFYIEKFPTISLWYKTEEEKDLALKKGKYRVFELPSLLKRYELSNIDSIEKYVDAVEKKLERHTLEIDGGSFHKIGDVPPKEGSNLKELWCYPFFVADITNPTNSTPLAGAYYLVKVHVG